MLLFALAHAADTWPDISSPPSATGGGERDAAVLIGIEDYSVLPDVPGAVANIRDWQAWFLTTRKVRPVAIEARLDDDAVDVNIRDAVQRAVARVQQGGTLWIVYAGHGAPTANGKEPMLVGADARPTVDGVRTRSILVSEIETLVSGGAQRQTVMVLDACFSGQGVDGGELVSEPLAAWVPESAMEPPPGLTVLAATSANQYAGLLPGTGRLAFSYLVLGGLRGWADGSADGTHDGAISAQEAGDYAAGVLKQTLTGRRQEPRVAGDGSVVLAAGRERGPDVSALARAVVQSPVGGVSLDLGGNTDFARAARAAQAKEEEARRMVEEAARARAEADALREQQLDEAELAVRWQASADWASVEPLLTATAGAETARVLEAFVAQYARAAVSADGVSRAVDVPEVKEARGALEALRARLARAGNVPIVSVPQPEGDWAERFAAGKADDERAREAGEAGESPVLEPEPRRDERLATSRSQADVNRGGSARVPLLVSGALVAAGGLGLLVAGGISEEQVLANVASGSTDSDEAGEQQQVVNALYGAGYAGLGLGIVLGGVSFAVPVAVDGPALVVSGRW